MSCIEDYPIIEQAINFGVESIGQKNAMAIQIAYFWIEGWLAAGGDGTITEEDARIIRNGVKNYYFM